MKLFLMVMGMVFIIEGFPYFISPEKWKEAVAYILKVEGKTLRLVGLGMMVLGIILIYLGKYL
ncbi:DUF2065 domain-containing protein [bacterium]|nr:DUF2065 domain-containing protein [bacterium]